MGRVVGSLSAVYTADQSTGVSCAGAAQAMGRVVGSLSVVTVRTSAGDGEEEPDEEVAESAMLASWLSQASFDPPGLTVAVKKDRASESLMVRPACVLCFLRECGAGLVAARKDRASESLMVRPSLSVACVPRLCSVLSARVRCWPRGREEGPRL